MLMSCGRGCRGRAARRPVAYVAQRLTPFTAQSPASAAANSHTCRFSCRQAAQRARAEEAAARAFLARNESYRLIEEEDDDDAAAAAAAAKAKAKAKRASPPPKADKVRLSEAVTDSQLNCNLFLFCVPQLKGRAQVEAQGTRAEACRRRGPECRGCRRGRHLCAA